LTGPQTAPAVGDGVVGAQALRGEVQQVNPPSLGVAVRDRRQQVTVGRIQIDPRQHRLAGLKQLIVAAGPHPGEVLGGVNRLSDADRLAHDRVHAAQRQGAIEQVPKEGHHAPKRAVTEQYQPQDDLAQPGFRDRQVEQHLIVLGLRRKRLRQRLGALGGLVIRKRAANPVTLGQLHDRCLARQHLQSQPLALLGVQLLGRTTHSRA
jgi:hypothetical protein